MLTEDTQAEMLRHAEEAAPEEACGLVVLGAHGEHVTVRITNISEDPEHNFEMAPSELLDIFPEQVVVGSYHSHPSGPPQPSKTDLKFAHPLLRNWLVCDGKVMEWSEHGLIDNA